MLRRTSFPARLLIAIVVLSACQGGSGSEASDAASADTTAVAAPSIPFRSDGTLTFLREDQALATIAIEVAATDSARERGLMQRTGLPEDSGMLFLFDREEPQSFWMANTPLALDIYFVDADSQIVNIARYTRPFSTESVPSIDPARYVIETEAGFADTHGIIEGDRVRWTLQAP